MIQALLIIIIQQQLSQQWRTQANQIAIYLHKKLVSCFSTHLRSCAASVKVTSECWQRNNCRNTTHCCYEQFARV